MSTPYLDITANGSSSRLPLVTDSTSIGRQIGNMLVIDDTEASRFHCVVEKVAAGYRVRDLGSRNGTRVNGQIVKVALLDDGDVIQVGKVEMKLMLKEPAGPAAAAAATARAKQAERVSGSSAVTFISSGKPQQSQKQPVVEDGNSLAFLPQDEYESITNPGFEFDVGAPDPGSGGEFDNEIIKGAGPLEIDTSQPPTDSLKQMADALPEHAFNHFDIALINARGAVAHAAGVPKKKGDESVGEAVTLLRLLLLVCFRTRASDIHIEPKNDLYLVRVRIDGGMVDAAKLKKEMGVRLCAVIKILSDIDISQKNIVQEGHFTSRVPDRRGRLPRELHARECTGRSASFACSTRRQRRATCGIWDCPSGCSTTWTASSAATAGWCWFAGRRVRVRPRACMQRYAVSTRASVTS